MIALRSDLTQERQCKLPLPALAQRGVGRIEAHRSSAHISALMVFDFAAATELELEGFAPGYNKQSAQ